MSTNNIEDRYRFCCGSFHAERGAYVIAICGSVLTGLGIIGAIVEMNGIDLITSTLTLGVYLAIIAAQKRNDPRLYLPFLGLVGFYIFLMVFMIVSLTFLAAFQPSALEHIFDVYGKNNYISVLFGDSLKDGQKEAEVRIAAFSVAFALSLFCSFHAWIWRIVYLAYEYMNLGLNSLVDDHIAYPHYNEV